MRAAAFALAFLLAATALALNKQGERADAEAGPSPVELSGYLFAGGFVWNPTYAARPNNSGRALGRFGLHLDLDFFARHLTLSYDENSFTDGLAETRRSPFAPSEADHILGLLTTWPASDAVDLTFAAHGELDTPWTEPNPTYRAAHPDCGPAPAPGCYQAGYTQSYADAYARVSVDAADRLQLFAALGLFAWNPSYASRPDNSGLALLRLVAHGEYELLPWLSLALDLNGFTDRDFHPLKPSELDTTGGLVLRRGPLQLSLVAEWDAPLGRYPSDGPHPSAEPGISQYYASALLQWSFELHLGRAHRRPADTSTLPQGHLPAVH